MIYWEKALKTDLSYEQAKKFANKGSCITRPEYNGIHFINRVGEYVVLLEDGNTVKNPTEIQDTDKNDWMIVAISDKGLDIRLKEEMNLNESI